MSPSSGLFAAAEVGNTVDNKTYDGEVSALRVELLNLQYDLQSADFPVVLLIAGDDRPAVVGLLRVLHEWMDARYLQNHVMFSSSHEEDTERPVLGRYWRRLPPAGRIGLFLGGWPTSTVRVALEEDWSMPRFDQALDHLARFEKLLADDGALVLKFWLHTPEAVLSERLTAAAADPEKYWDFAQHDWEVFERFDDVYRLIERLIRRTNNITAPWSIIESTDPRYCNLTVGRSIADAVAARLAQPPKVVAPVQPDTASGQSLLEQIDLNAAVDKATYTEGLARLQGRINQLAYQLNEAGIPCVFVFEGVDAAGKGGAIRRLVAALPVQHVRVIPISAPNPAERAHHYLWRFWTRLPRAGKTVIFDRSWYGRVLVERVEGLAREDEWRRAYEEINEFEAMLHDSGAVLCKFWLQIDGEEQLARFEVRAQTPYKKYKLTVDDFRNRAKWDQYQAAAHDMLARTSTRDAPWTLIAANDKQYSRLQVLQAVAEAMEMRLQAAGIAAVRKPKTKKRKKSKAN